MVCLPSFLFTICIEMAVQWVYASGSSWIALDRVAQMQIESLWKHSASGWVVSTWFQGAVYVDASEMVLLFGGYSYAIARRKN